MQTMPLTKRRTHTSRMRHGHTRKKRGKKYNTYILLMAKEDIPAGTEIRTDYDNGVTGAPFRQKLIGEGVPAAALDAIHYKRVRWEQPRGVGSAPAVID